MTSGVSQDLKFVFQPNDELDMGDPNDRSTMSKAFCKPKTSPNVELCGFVLVVMIQLQ